MSTIQKIFRPVASLFSGQSLGVRAFRGAAVLGIGSGVEQVIRFARNIILARILAPDAFGTMAIVMAIGYLVETVAEIGIREAVIQNPKGDREEYMNVAWWLAMGRAVLLYGAVVAATPWLARFYENPDLEPLLHVSLLTILFYGAMSTRSYVGLKQLNFRNQAIINHGGGIIGVIVALVLSFWLRNVWALVIGFCVEVGARCALSYILYPFLPSLRFDKDASRDLLKFSRGVYGLTLLNLIFSRADVFLLAKLLSPADLGIYTMAVYLVQTPRNFLIGTLNQVMMPTLSGVQADVPRVGRILTQVTSAIALLGVPIVVMMFFCGPALLTLAYGAAYAEAAVPLMLASCVALLHTLNGLLTSVFYSLGVPQLHRRCLTVMTIIVIALIYPLVGWLGATGAQAACLLAIAAGYGLQVVRIRKLINLDLQQYGKSIEVALASSLAVVAVCSLALPFESLSRPVPTVIIGALGVLLSYGLALPTILREISKIGFGEDRVTQTRTATARIQPQTCPLCGHAETNEILVGPDRFHARPECYELVECKTCSLVWLANPPRPEDMGHHYGVDYDRLISAAGEYSPERWRDRIQTLEKYKTGGALLDLGCGSGGFLTARKGPTWVLYGIEMSEETAKRAGTSSGAAVFTGDILEANFPEGSFDAITCFDVLEHVYHPRAVLEKVAYWLKPGGVFYTLMPNIHSAGARMFGSYWYALELPRHLFHFSPKSLRLLTQSVGLEEVSISTSRQLFVEYSVGYLYDDLLRRMGVVREPLSRWEYPSLLKRVLLKLVRIMFLPFFWLAALFMGDGESIHAVLQRPHCAEPAAGKMKE